MKEELKKEDMPSEWVSEVEKVAKEFARHCSTLLAEAYGRRDNQEERRNIEVSAGRLQQAAAEALEQCGLLRCTGGLTYTITDKGIDAYREIQANLAARNTPLPSSLLPSLLAGAPFKRT